MSKDLPTVCVFGALDIKLQSPGPVPNYETRDMDCRCYLTDDGLGEILTKDRPDVIVTFGENTNDFPNLLRAPFDVRRKWIHAKNTNNLDQTGVFAFNCFISDCFTKRNDMPMLASIFTPTYKISEEKIHRTYESIKRQTYPEWEWVIIDDSDDDGQTYKILCDLASKDYRISVLKQHRHSGIIGEVKNKVAMSCRGSVLIEMDHDDELTENAVEDIVAAFKKFPEAGFVYTDFCELSGEGKSLTYGAGWGFGYGSYRKETYKGQELDVANASNINPKTIRHIVAAPNHVRAWRTGFYRFLGGHNRKIHIADDYELMVRTFLTTRMVRMPKLCYLQYLHSDGSNLQRVRNAEIQRMVRYIKNIYDKKIHERFKMFGINDYVWDEKTGYSNLNVPNPEKEEYCNFIA